MDCSAFEKELGWQFHELELSGEAWLHADSCRHCRLLVKSQQAILSTIAEEKKALAPPFLSTRVMAGLPNREGTGRFMPVWKQALQLAVVLLAMVGGYWGSVMMDQRAATDDFNVVLSDYFFMGDTGLTIEEGWLYSGNYENE